MKKIFQKHQRLFLFLLLSVFLFSACEKEEVPEYTTENEVFLDHMKQWYLWNDQIPDVDPDDYSSVADLLEAIRYIPVDRWSMITEWGPYYAYITNSEFIGYGFGSKYDASGNLRVTFVYSSTAMYAAGVRRGWIVQAVNGTPVTPTVSVSQLLGADAAGVSNTFNFMKPNGEVVELTLVKDKIIMNTVLHHEVINYQGKNIGYLVLQGFTGTTPNELKQVFALFNQQQISELILDLRYNGGGLVSVAQELSSLIGGTNLVGKHFAHYVYNENKSTENSNLLFTAQENSLNLERLITICTRATASASELVINGLRPYMDVKIVGTNTYGKPVGANIFQFNEKWALVPITFRILNANNEGDYFEGIDVDIPANDGLEFMFGDRQEESLQKALDLAAMGIAKSQPVEVIPYEQPFEGKWSLRRMIGAW